MKLIEFEKVISLWDKYHYSIATHAIEFDEELRKLPTVDAVPVIRCKDCKWHRESECYAWDDGTVAVVSETPDDGFCYRAEREEDGTDVVNTAFTDKDAHFGEVVLRVIRDVDTPMLMYEGEKEAVKKALIMALDKWAERKEE